VEYVVLVALVFAFFYPLYAFVGLNAHDLELRLWLPSWR
jgi:dolichyl-phosphate-mannose--protein O-mannosyl transferase